jgi:hypothetical protein
VGRQGSDCCAWLHTGSELHPQEPDISIGAKTTYALFLSYAWHNQFCFPGQERLAKDMGMGIASVNRFIKELEGCDLIEITRRGQGKTNLYTINFVVSRELQRPSARRAAGR